MYPGEKMPTRLIAFIIIILSIILGGGYTQYLFGGWIWGLIWTIAFYLECGLLMCLILTEVRFYRLFFNWLYYLFYPEKL